MTTTVEKIKDRESRKKVRIEEKKRKKTKRIARRILKLRARGVKSFRADSKLGEKVYELNGFRCFAEDSLYEELRLLGIELSDEENIIKIII